LLSIADQICLEAGCKTSGRVAQTHTQVPAELIVDMQVWRAATDVDRGEQRSIGPAQLGHASRVWRRQLDMRLAAADAHTDRHWQQLLAAELSSVTADRFLPELAEKLKNLTQAGFDATLLLRSAAAAGALPDDHPAAALGGESSTS
jgi:hypothetical protein